MARSSNEDDNEIELSQEMLEGISTMANELLAAAEEDYNDAKQGTADAEKAAQLRQEDVKKAKDQYDGSPTEESRYQLSQATSAKKEADNRLEVVKNVEHQCEADYKGAMKNAILAEVRKDYSELKPQAEAVKKLETKQLKLSDEVGMLKAIRDENKDNNKRTGYLDKQIAVKSEKLGALTEKIASRKEKLTNIVDTLLAKCQENSPQNNQAQDPSNDKRQFKTVSAHQLLSEAYKHEAGLRQQLNAVMQKQTMLKKKISGTSQYAHRSEVRELNRELNTFQRSARQLNYEINHEQKAIAKLKSGIEAGQTEVIIRQHKRADEHHPAKKEEASQALQASPNQEPSLQKGAGKAKHQQEAKTQEENDERAPLKRTQAMDQFVGFGMMLEREIMESVKKGENVEENLGEGAKTVLDVIEVVVGRNIALKEAIDLDKDSSGEDVDNESQGNKHLVHQHKAELDTREMRSIPSEMKYGQMKRKSGSQTDTSAGAAADTLSIAPTRLGGGGTKLK